MLVVVENKYKYKYEYNNNYYRLIRIMMNTYELNYVLLQVWTSSFDSNILYSPVDTPRIMKDCEGVSLTP